MRSRRNRLRQRSCTAAAFAYQLVVLCHLATAQLFESLREDVPVALREGGEVNSGSSQRVSVQYTRADKQDRALPSWCKDPREREAGAWHSLSDDEYSEESPYLQCALPPGLQTSPQLPSQRRAARTATRQGLVAAGANASCASVLRIPKVALMFLTQEAMPHERLWEKWLASVAGLVPTLCTANAVCARGGFKVLPSIVAACGKEAITGRSVYEQQFLFTVYIHARPDYPPRGKESVFYGRDTLVSRLHTRWGDHSTVEVTRRLLGAALKDPDNQRFLLLSETCVPLYSALVVYQQLMHEWRSRISACAVPGWDRSIERYNVRMAAGRREYGRIKIEHWRKHMHWFSLVRFHAELVVNDTEIVDTFARDCFMGYDLLSAEESQYRFCMGDEHYVSTLIAVYGLDAQTDCMGRLTHAQFSRDSEHPEHPKSYSEAEVVPNLFRQLRLAHKEPGAAANFARQSFRCAEGFNESDSIWHVPYPDVKQLKQNFYLFARKFPADTAEAVLKILTENDDRGERLGIFGGLHRPGGAPHVETQLLNLVDNGNG